MLEIRDCVQRYWRCAARARDRKLSIALWPRQRSICQVRAQKPKGRKETCMVIRGQRGPLVNPNVYENEIHITCFKTRRPPADVSHSRRHRVTKTRAGADSLSSLLYAWLYFFLYRFCQPASTPTKLATRDAKHRIQLAPQTSPSFYHFRRVLYFPALIAPLFKPIPHAIPSTTRLSSFPRSVIDFGLSP